MLQALIFMCHRTAGEGALEADRYGERLPQAIKGGGGARGEWSHRGPGDIGEG